MVKNIEFDLKEIILRIQCRINGISLWCSRDACEHDFQYFGSVRSGKCFDQLNIKCSRTEVRCCVLCGQEDRGEQCSQSLSGNLLIFSKMMCRARHNVNIVNSFDPVCTRLQNHKTHRNCNLISRICSLFMLILSSFKILCAPFLSFKDIYMIFDQKNFLPWLPLYMLFIILFLTSMPSLNMG
jgi:hypothetical protein